MTFRIQKKESSPDNINERHHYIYIYIYVQSYHTTHRTAGIRLTEEMHHNIYRYYYYYYCCYVTNRKAGRRTHLIGSDKLGHQNKIHHSKTKAQPTNWLKALVDSCLLLSRLCVSSCPYLVTQTSTAPGPKPWRRPCPWPKDQDRHRQPVQSYHTQPIAQQASGRQRGETSQYIYRYIYI